MCILGLFVCHLSEYTWKYISFALACSHVVFSTYYLWCRLFSPKYVPGKSFSWAAGISHSTYSSSKFFIRILYFSWTRQQTFSCQKDIRHFWVFTCLPIACHSCPIETTNTYFTFNSMHAVIALGFYDFIGSSSTYHNTT